MRLALAVMLTMLWPAYSAVAADDAAFNQAQVTTLMDDGFHQEALEALRRAPMQTDAELAQVLLLTSRLYCVMGSPKSSIGPLKSAAALLGSDDAGLLLEQTRVYLAMGEIKAARNWLDRLNKKSSLSSNDKLTRTLLAARIEQAVGNTLEAITLLGATKDSESLTLARADVLEASGSVGDARNGLKEFLKSHPRSGRVLLAAGRLSEQLEDREAAKSYYQKALTVYKETGDRTRLPGIEQRLERLARERALTTTPTAPNVPPSPPPNNVTPVQPAPPAPAVPITVNTPKQLPQKLQSFPFSAGSRIVTGSGVLVDQGRRIITNRHVVAEGHNFYVRNALGDMSAARVEKLGSNDDLAVLVLDKPFLADKALRPDQFGKARSGASIAVMGFPLTDMLGANTPSITNGIVSKATGMRDNVETFQVSAKMNKGNSGGAVFDQAGNLVGIAVGKLDLVKIMQGEGFLPEDVNFAIHSERIGQLGIATKVNGAGGKALSLEELYQQYIGTVVMIAGEK
jgi:S1-C subfamily serine protease/Tfp pilus assembly protein PilF